MLAYFNYADHLLDPLSADVLCDYYFLVARREKTGAHSRISCLVTGLTMFARPSDRHLEVTERKRVQRRISRRIVVVQVLAVKSLGRQILLM